jgi:hypothetical protein
MRRHGDVDDAGVRSQAIDMTQGAKIRPDSFALEEYFSGRVRAWGIVQDRFGRLRRQFTVDLEGRREGDLLTLHETFHYDDGASSRRRWTLRRKEGARYEGRAADVVGMAVGHVEGNRFLWRYRLRLPIGGRTWRLSFRDEMLLQSDGVMINRATMRKLGIRLAELTIVFRRLETAGTALPPGPEP